MADARPTPASHLSRRSGRSSPSRATGRHDTGSDPDTTGRARALLQLQRTVGNRAIGALLQRDDDDAAPEVDVDDVRLNHRAVTVPPEGGLTLDADPVPDGATNVAFSLSEGSATISSATTIDATSGAITIGADQTGGNVDVVATSHNPSATATASLPLNLVEHPTGIASTTSTESTSAYGGEFTHTFTAPSRNAAALENGWINERFDALTATQPWGGTFTLTANAATSTGWALDGNGTMTGPDHVTIDRTLDAHNLVANASNPTPASILPASFTMTQRLRAKNLPSGTWSDTNFTSVDHTGGVRESGGELKVFVSANGDELEQDYVGPPAYRNLAAATNPVTASAPRPAAPTTVQFTADVLPSSAAEKFFIQGPALGCSINDSGLLQVGTTAGTIRVRVSSGPRGSSYDEVVLTIQAPPTPIPGGGEVQRATR